MGVDLKLLPLAEHDYWVSHDVSSLERRAELWPDIEALEQHDVPDRFVCYLARRSDGETCYGEVKEDRMGIA